VKYRCLLGRPPGKGLEDKYDADDEDRGCTTAHELDARHDTINERQTTLR